jgi:hypothetical protein
MHSREFAMSSPVTALQSRGQFCRKTLAAAITDAARAVGLSFGGLLANFMLPLMKRKEVSRRFVQHTRSDLPHVYARFK